MAVTVPGEARATASITNPNGEGEKAVRRLKVFAMLAAAAGASLMAAVMTASPASADTQGTTTDLILPSSRVVFGLESSFTMQVDISSAFEGNWGITAGSPATGSIPLCGGSLPATTSCTIPAGALPPGNYNLVAVYGGSENFSPSGSGLVPLTVIAQQPTNTSLSLSPATVIAGQEQSEDLEFNVSGDTGNPATGPVTVLAGSTPLSQCTNIGVNAFGNGSCSLNPSELQPGTYHLTASFGGSQNFVSSTSAPQTLTVVAQQSTTTSLTLSAPSVTFPNEQTETLTATVAPQLSGTPTGHVTVTSGSTFVCNIGLANGPTAKCTLNASQLTPGSYPLTATYSGDNLFLTSTDTSQTLTVAKEPTTTNLALSADTIALGSEQAELFTVQVTPATGGTPTGNVTVKSGATAVCTIILAGGTGNCTLTPSQLARGTHQITATYNGDATYATATSSPPQTLTVGKKGSGAPIGGPAAGLGRSRPLIWGLAHQPAEVG